MRSGIQIRDKTIVQQMASIKVKYADFDVRFDRNALIAVGELQPTSRSQAYTIEIKYRFGQSPKVYILEPRLVRNFKGEKIPHIYAGERLCLFHPKYQEFRVRNYISETIIPWTSLWLYHYEVWHITGDWLGGGEQPQN